MDPTLYCCGFAFDTVGRVLLIEKKRPLWQAGRWNGIGGHIESGESPDAAMAREFEEETGLVVPRECWEEFVQLHDSNVKWIVHFYRAFDIDLEKARSMTDELVGSWMIGDCIPKVPNTTWLIPLALQPEIRGPGPGPVILIDDSGVPG